MFVVFLGNKLISCDTIVPLALELRQRQPKRPIWFYCRDPKTLKIIEQNIFLYDAITSMGRLMPLVTRKPGPVSPFVRRIRSLAVFAWILLNALVRGASFIHFGEMHNRPFRWLYRLWPQRTYLVESDIWSRSELVSAVGRLMPGRGARAKPPEVVAAGALVAFGEKWPELAKPENAMMRCYVVGPSRMRKVWLDHVRQRADGYIDRELVAAGLEPGESVVGFMLGAMDGLYFVRRPDVLTKLFRETLEVLVEHAADRPIFVKPHAITDLDPVHDIIDGFDTNRIVISHLHPQVLATRAHFVVANYYSTTLADVYALDVPTIEYTDYSDEALRITNHGSMRPEFVTHFINHDRAAFERLVGNLSSVPPRSAWPEGATGDESGLLARLAEHDSGLLRGRPAPLAHLSTLS